MDAVRALAAADAERRAIERSVHDVVQQGLVALSVNLQLARRALDTDMTEAQTLLDDLCADVHRLVDETRLLSERVYPSLLAAAGLGRAIGAAASRFGITLDLQGPVARQAEAVEASAYFTLVAALLAAVPPARGELTARGDAVELRLAPVDEARTAAARDRALAFGGDATLQGDELLLVVPLYDPFSDR